MDPILILQLIFLALLLRRRYAIDPGAALLFLSAGDDMVGSIFDELLDVEPTTCHAAYHSYL